MAYRICRYRWIEHLFFLVKQVKTRPGHAEQELTDGLETVDVYVLESYSQDVMYKDQGRTLGKDTWEGHLGRTPATPVDIGDYRLQQQLITFQEHRGN
jgi:hypothetical protein